MLSPIRHHDTTSLLRMPKNMKKGKRLRAEAASAQADDDFDEMLAEVMAEDTTSSTTITTTTASSTSSTSSSSSNPGTAARRTTHATEEAKERVSADAIFQCCVDGDNTQLRRWARQGVRVVSAVPLCAMAQLNNLDVLRILINELGADVNKAVAGYKIPRRTVLFPCTSPPRWGTWLR
jgi:hypothetical protein